MAQVYSQNAVGYVNLTIRPGFNMISAPMLTPSRTLTSLIPAASNPQADGAVFYKWTGVGYSIQTLDISGAGDWDPNPNETIPMGKGGFMFSPQASPFTLTFVGEVAQGALSTTYFSGFDFVASQVPQAGLITTVLGFTPADGDVAYQWINNGVDPVGYQINTYDLSGAGDWDPAQPVLQVGGSVLLKTTGARVWNRTFSVN